MPNYGRETEYFSWQFCVKTWKMSNYAPRIKGDPDNIQSLKSRSRRIIDCDMGRCFSSSPDDLDVENLIFEEI